MNSQSLYGRLMQNPWIDLPGAAPYVLPGDQPHIKVFNSYMKPRFRLDTNLMPQPFVGNRQAPLVILSRNPGAEGHHNDAYADAIKTNLTSEAPDQLFPALEVRFEMTQGAKWWGSCLDVVASKMGSKISQLAGRVQAIEFHGYHSRSWRALPITLPSQRFGFWLVEQAMIRRATIVVVRGQRDWTIAVPNLGSYPLLVPIKNPRSASISPGNCGTKGFRRVLDSLVS